MYQLNDWMTTQRINDARRILDGYTDSFSADERDAAREGLACLKDAQPEYLMNLLIASQPSAFCKTRNNQLQRPRHINRNPSCQEREIDMNTIKKIDFSRSIMNQLDEESTEVLLAFARWCALQVLPIWENDKHYGYITLQYTLPPGHHDPRIPSHPVPRWEPNGAIVRQFLETGDVSLAAAAYKAADEAVYVHRGGLLTPDAARSAAEAAYASMLPADKRTSIVCATERAWINAKATKFGDRKTAFLAAAQTEIERLRDLANDD